MYIRVLYSDAISFRWCLLHENQIMLLLYRRCPDYTHAVNIVVLAWYVCMPGTWSFLLRPSEYREHKVNNHTTTSITAVVAAILTSTEGSFKYSRARVIRARSLELRWVDDTFLGGHTPEGVECTAKRDTWSTSHIYI